MSNRFRSIALALRPYVGGTYDLLEAADAVVALDGEVTYDRPTITSPDGKATWDWNYKRWNFHHADLVDMVLSNDTILAHLFDSKKINAIKELRTVARCGLKEAKEAVEDQKVADFIASERSNPWSRWNTEEPPF